MSSQQPRNLTEFELMAQVSRLDLADGHANHSLRPETLGSLESAFAAALKEERHGLVHRVEREFLSALGRHTGQPYAAGSSHIVYSASVGVDIMAKYLAVRRYRTGMITPTFDNLPALMTMTGVELVPVPELRVMPEPDLDALSRLGLDALFLVLPNNPTGAVMDEAAVRRLFAWGAAQRVLIVVDASFRLLDPRACVDLIDMAEQADADAVTIDDTGKTVSLQDTKASVLSVTHRMCDAVSEVVSHCLLNVSCLDLRLLTTVLTMPPDHDEIGRARTLARRNRAVLRELLTSCDRIGCLPDSSPGQESALSIEWLHIGPERDRVLRRCRGQGLQILPGQPFFWATGGGEQPHTGEWVRIALLRDPEEFRRGADIFASALRARA
ncbi:aminotransferase class I/II-fold pyridoxal phosphate-dependent enzyme [Streptomyces sp. NPDC008137]|uniref:aminotransferase class I/II-fold pyridoxal phosphate-dependent enzyme n=1 Tax=Streptomyces sp. NPDC008137 TaxID=3364813 RepID=UPI0036EAEA21